MARTKVLDCFVEASSERRLQGAVIIQDQPKNNHTFNIKFTHLVLIESGRKRQDGRKVEEEEGKRRRKLKEKVQRHKAKREHRF